MKLKNWNYSSLWEDYYRMRLFPKQQEQKMISTKEESQIPEKRPAILETTAAGAQRIETPLQRFVRDHPFLRACRRCQIVQEGQDLHELD